MILKFNRKNTDGELEEREYELSTKLSVAVTIQKQFGNKPFIKIVQGLKTLLVEDLIRFLACAYKGTQAEINAFKEDVMDSELGLGGVYDAVSDLIMGIQYPGLSADEIEKKVQAQQVKAQEMGIGLEQLSNEEPLSD